MCLDVSRDTGVPLFANDSNWGSPKGFQEPSARLGLSSARFFSSRGLDDSIFPADKMLPRNVGQGTNPVVALVEAGQEVKFPASRTEEDFSALDADLFERLEAIRHESRTDHVYAAHAALAVVG